jgi:TonB family protein
MTVAKKQLLGALAGALALHAAAILAAARLLHLAHVAPSAQDVIYVIVQRPSGDFHASRLANRADAALEPPIAARRVRTTPQVHRAQSKRQVKTALRDRVESTAALESISRDRVPVGAGRATAYPLTGASDDIAHRPGPVAYAPEPLKRVVPDYPSAARIRGIEGQVILRAIVDQQGHVEDSIEVVQTVPALDQAAIAALRRWSFSPGRDRYGRPLRVRVEVPIVFVLR